MLALITSRANNAVRLPLLVCMTAMIVGVGACREDASSLPTVSTRATCPDPRIEPMVVPLDMDSAAEVVIGCSLDLKRVRLEDEETFLNGTVGLTLDIQRTWLRDRDKGVAKVLLDLGVQDSGLMSGLILSAAWHHANGVPFDVGTRLKCFEALRAAKAVPKVMVQGCFATSPKPRG